jgi:ubiquinone/menaquinone biosynthesis C-methylase UbiE
MRRLGKTLLSGALGGMAGIAYWWRKNPSACPYSQRFWVQTPHPLITRPRLLQILSPKEGERVLEIGPGTGYYSLDVARALAPSGELHLFDLQREMLAHTLARGRGSAGRTLVATQGDAVRLPYTDESFDAAYIVCTLGEIPGREEALRELRRVLKPGGRLVVGELVGDPHMVRFERLRSEASAARLPYRRRLGSGLGYFARFELDV